MLRCVRKAWLFRASARFDVPEAGCVSPVFIAQGLSDQVAAVQSGASFCAETDCHFGAGCSGCEIIIDQVKLPPEI
jgi:hypothetical protein